MGDEHLSTMSETESDKVIKSSVANLVPIPSEFEDFSDNKSECDVPVCDDFKTFSNPIFDSDDDFSSSDDESFSVEDVPKENFKIYSNPLFDNEIISSKIDLHHFNAKFDLIESLLNQDISTIYYPKIDSFLEEFSGELTNVDLVPPGNNKADFYLEEEIRLIEELFDDPFPLPKNESSNFDHHDDPSFPRPLSEPPDVEIFFDFKHDIGEYSQWVERYMNNLEEQTNGEAMINSIKNGDQPLPRVTQVSIAGTSSIEQPPLKDKSMCCKNAKDLWDALARHMLGSEYGEQDRKAVVLYEYETFKATEGELLLDTYIRYLQVINDLNKCGYSEDNCELNFKFLNNLQPKWKQYAIMMRQNKNLMDINIDALYNILKQNQGDVNDAMGLKKKIVVVTSDPLALIAEKTNVSKSKEKVFVSSDSKGSEADDFSELKKITALLAKAFNRRKFYSTSTNKNLRTSSTSQSANKKQEFVKTDNKKVEKKDDEKKRDMSKVKCYNFKKEGHFAKDCKKVKVKDYEY
nr:hypothetical protein [Tanacetum cinerariifolium]